MHQIRFRLELRPRPRWESSHSAPPDALAGFKGGLLLKGGEGKGEEGKGIEGRGGGKGRKKGKKGGKGRGGGHWIVLEDCQLRTLDPPQFQ